MAKTKKYDVFIAYHGTSDKNGSCASAKKICDYLKSPEIGFEVYLHGYSMLPEHKDVQWNRTWEIIDDCECFLTVVNDHVNRNHGGRLGNDLGEQESQIRSEVDGFYDLIIRNMRSRSDFNFFYVGSKLKGEQQISFFRELHSQIISGHNELIAWEGEEVEKQFHLIKEWLDKRGLTISEEERQLKKLRELLESLGWGKSILFSPAELHTYEEKISPDLKSIMLVAANTTDDIKGGKLFPLVAKNLARGVHYSYLFFEYPGAKKQLENIYASHDEKYRDNLEMRLVKSKAWISADILLIKIYEYTKDVRPEIFFRIKMSTDQKSEQCIYIKGDNNKIPIIQQEIDDLLEELNVQRFDGKTWISN